MHWTMLLFIATILAAALTHFHAHAARAVLGNDLDDATDVKLSSGTRRLSADLGAWLAEEIGDERDERDEHKPRRSGDDEPVGCSPEALEFIHLFNLYRTELGLDWIPPSPSLCIVSDTHVKDLVEHRPDAGDRCGMHSWSSNGAWTPCCFLDTRYGIQPDPEMLRCSWNKPIELTDYPAKAYENTLFDAGADDISTPRSALEEWKKSKSHHMLMINGEDWSDNDFNAVGAGFLGKYAVMWLGEVHDPMS